MKKRTIIKLSNYILSLVVIAITITVCVSFFMGNKSENSTFRATTTPYKTSQFELKDSTHSNSSDYKKISDYYTLNGNSVSLVSNITDTNSIITISSASDFYALSLLLNTYSAFLDNSFLLLNNINYTSNNPEFVPIGWNEEEFTGTFDGNGYEVTNLRLVNLTNSNYGETKTYENMKYYAIFSTIGESGVVKNVGFVSPSLIINATPAGMTAVSVVTGSNKGRISNTYVKMLGNPEDEVGISAAGGFVISGFVYSNTGIIEDCYCAYDIVVNYTLKDYISFREFLDINLGTLNNCYFYNASIDEYTIEGNKTIIAYDNGLIGRTFTYDLIQNLARIESLSDFSNSDKFNSEGYYTNSSYTNLNIKSALNIETPILRGLKESDNTGLAFDINNSKDYIYMYELFNKNSYFASSSITYNIKSDIDLSIYNQNFYAYSDYVFSNIIGNDINGSVKNVANQSSVYPTIYGATIMNKSLVSGIECYGLFPLFSGVIKNINIYSTNDFSGYDSATSSAPLKVVGSLIGYSEGAIIDNVNVSIKSISLAQSNGKYYAGGVVGYATSNTNLTNITSTGIIDGGTHDSYTDLVSGYLPGNALGGIVGYSSIGGLSMNTCLSAMNINSTVFNSSITISQSIGGILGAGYVNDFENITNKGKLVVGTNTNNTGTVYCAGVVGRLLGVSKQISKIHNQGDIDANLNDNASYISGVINVDILTTTTNGLPQSTYKNRKGLSLFEISSVTNCNNISLKGSSKNNYVSGMFYIKSDNGFATTASGIYNISYKYKVGTSTYINEYEKESFKVEMSLLSEFAPVIVTNSTSETYSLSLSTVYNLRDITYSTESQVSLGELKYSGCISGKNYNLTNVRNEGDLLFNITNNITSSTGSLKVYGLFEEMSPGFKGTTLVNSGNIDFDIKATVAKDIYASGICYANRSNFTSATYDEYDPLSSNYNKNAIGSLNNVINNGNITQFNETAPLTFSKNVRFSGICLVNEAVISSAFNLGNLRNSIIFSNNSYAELAGISWIMTGEYAQIKDCANNGLIKNINMQFSNANNVNSDVTYGFINSGGLVCRNDTLESGNYSTSSHHKQYILYSVNYGEVVAYNKKTNVSYSSTNYSVPSTVSAGILSQGLCGVINTVNYGNIYGSEIISGMIGVIDLSKYTVSANSGVTFSNSINYGNILALRRIKTVNGTPVRVDYDELVNLELTITGSDDTVVKEAYSSEKEYSGSAISFINYNNSSNAQYIRIRYLINFNTGSGLVGYEFNVPGSVQGATETMFTARTNDRYLNSSIVYAPLSSLRDDDGNIGVFSPDFAFRKAIEGRLQLDITNYPTDAFLTDYFQFIAFSKVNDELLDSIGWSTIAYMNAAELFSNDLSVLTTLLKEYNESSSLNYDSLVEKALNTDTWISKCNSDTLSEIIEDILSSQSTNQLQAIVKSLFFESEYKNSINSSFKQTIINRLLVELDENKDGLINIIETTMYSDLIANIISEEDSEKLAIKNLIEGYIKNLDSSTIEDLAYNYIDILSNSNLYDVLFSNSKYSKERYNLLETLLTGLDSTVYTDILRVISQNGESDSAKMIAALEKLNDSQIKEIYTSILNSDDLSNSYNKILSILNKMDLTTYTEENDSATSSFSITADKDKVELWNAIKKDSTVSDYLEEILDEVTSVDNIKRKGLYALATEYRNSYQSNNAPSGNTLDYNPSTGLTSTGNGRFRATSTAAPQNTRYIYTPDEYVSDAYTNNSNKTFAQTYYYGPYVNGNGNYLWNRDNSNGASQVGFELFKNTAGQGVIVTYVPIFISLDRDYLDSLVSQTDENKKLYKFMWNDVNTKSSSVSQWVSEDIITKVPDDNQTVLKKNNSTYNKDFTSDNNSYLIVNGYNYSTAESTTTNLEINKGIAYNNIACNASSWSEESVLFAYCSASIITGIYYQHNQWATNGAYLTAKAGEGQGVVTTQYIDYSIQDLVALDGIRTKGMSSGAYDKDEAEIITTLVNKILSTNKGKSIALTAYGKTLNSINPSDSNSLIKAYLTSLGNDSSYYKEFIGNIPYMEETHTLATSITYNNIEYKSVKEYLLAISPTVSTLEDLKKILLYSVDSKKNYEIIMQYLFNTKYGYYSKIEGIKDNVYSWIASKYAESNIYDLIHDYINGNSNLSEEELKVIIDSASTQSINDYLNTMNSLVNSSTNITDTTFNFSDNLKLFLNYKVNGSSLYNVSISSTTGNGTITFTTPNTLGTYTFVMTSSGNGNVIIDNNTNVVSGDIGSYEFKDLLPNKQYTVNVSNGVSLYDLQLIYNQDNSYKINSTGLSYTGEWTVEDISSNLANYTKTLIPGSSDSTLSIVIPDGETSVDITMYSALSNGEFTFNDEVYKLTDIENKTTINGLTSGNTYVIKNVSKASICEISFGKELLEEGYSTFEGVDIAIIDTNNIIFTGMEMISDGYLKTGGASGGSRNIRITIPSDYTGIVSANFCSNNSSTATVGLGLETSKYDNQYGSASSSPNASTRTDFNSSEVSTGTYYLTFDTSARFYSIILQLTPSKSTYASNYNSYKFDQVIFDSSKIYPKANNENLTITTSPTSNYGLIASGSSTLSINGIQVNTNLTEYLFNQETTTIELTGTGVLNISSVYSKVISSSLDNVALYNKYNQHISSNYLLDDYMSNGLNKYIVDKYTANTVVRTDNLTFTISSNSTIYFDVAITSGTGQVIFTAQKDSYYVPVTVSGKKSIKLPNGDYTISTGPGLSAIVNNIVAISNTSSYLSSDELENARNDIYTNTSSYTDYFEYINRYEVFKNLSSDKTRSEYYSSIVSLFYAVHSNDQTHPDLQLYNEFTEEQLKEIIKYLGSYDSKVLESIINNYTSSDNMKSYLIWTIAEICKSNSNFLQEVMNKVELSINNLSEDLKYKFTAAYIGTDLQQNLSMLQNSVLYEILVNFPSYYQFINADGSLNNTKFIAAMNHFGFNLSTDGYGIYALSSSKGILNGQFIPDNISLDSMDANYKETQDGANKYYEVTDTNSSDWRGDSSNQNSIYYKVTTEMKQLKKSIATTVFELVLTDGTRVIYSSTELIDLVNNTITFYIPNSYTGEFTIRSYIISDLATIDYVSFKVKIGQDATFIVTAEDDTVTTEYTVHLEVMEDIILTVDSVTGDLPTSDSIPQVSANNGYIDIVLKTNLPIGFDFTRYINLYNNNTLFNEMYNLRNQPYVYAENNSNYVLISLSINAALSKGNSTIKVELFDKIVEVIFNKVANTGANITLFEYEGNNVNFVQSNNNVYTATTNISFGRMFTSAEFDLNSDDFYLSDLAYSPGANVSLSVTYQNKNQPYNTIPIDGFEDGVLTYVLTYTVTSEDEATVNTYIHYLKELTPFDMKNDSSELYVESYVNVSLNGASITPNYNDNEIGMNFNRDNATSYRINYSLSNFYFNSILSSYLSINYKTDISIISFSMSVNNTGIIINFDEDTHPGEYTFNLVYNCNNGEYTRKYNFPAIVINCNYSKDSLLNSITFYESAVVLSNTATVMSNLNFRPALQTEESLSSEELLYNEYLNNENKGIVVTSRGIEYNQLSNEKDYFIVGSVSGAQLINYSPIFKINQHSKIYQYTTEAMIKGYGKNVGQTRTDTSILTDRTDNKLYILVPYLGSDGIEVNFIVECVNGVWTNVFTADLLGSGMSFDATESNENKYFVSSNNTEFVRNEITYKVSDNSGSTTNNISLYMDYIGTPLDSHFWYVSYVIFSEDAINKAGSSAMQFYHISLIDATNTIYFNISITNETSVDLGDSLYLNIVDNYFPNTTPEPTVPTQKNISAFFGNNGTGNYYSNNNLQVLPRGYFYFYLSLPEGFICSYDITTSNKENNIKYEFNEYYDVTDDSYGYLPPSSIVTQTIDVVITIKEADSGIIWGQSNNTYYVQEASYSGKYRVTTA